MPELPEVESLRRGLETSLRGAHVVRVDVRRPDVVRGAATPRSLLQGRHIGALLRHGKQMAMMPAGTARPCVCIHLGMSGTLVVHPTAGPPLPHTHVIWYLHDGRAVHFRDPRRFGGIWTYPTRKRLQVDRWDVLGPDALAVDAGTLHQRLATTRRAVKAALLDQQCIAGLGNIYVDELLFRCRLHPLTPGNALRPADAVLLVDEMRDLLRSAVRAGGSTFRDHRDASGRPGRFQNGHQVYGRSGQPCRCCQRPLHNMLVAARTSVYCSRCQRQRRGLSGGSTHRTGR